MATVIDKLVVELGLDPKNFTRGQRDALDAFKKTQEELARRSKDVEHGSKSVGHALSNLKTQALGLFGVFLGGKGIVNFTTGVGQADASVGRLGRSIGQSTRTISAWQGATRVFGGSAEEMAGQFTALSDAFAGWKIGIVSPIIADLRAVSAAGGTVIDVNKGVEQSFIDLADNLKTIHDKDPAQAGVLGRKLGLTPAFFDMLIRGGDEVRKTLAEVKKLGTTTDESAKAAADLNSEYQQSLLVLENVGRNAIVYLVKPLSAALGFAKDLRHMLSWQETPARRAEVQAQSEKLHSDLRSKFGEPTGFFKELSDWIIEGENVGKDTTLGEWLSMTRSDLLKKRGGSGAEPSDVWTGRPPLSVKPGAGAASSAISKLATDLQGSIPGLGRFTAFDDQYHALLGRSSAHSRGRALDFTLKDPAQSEAIAESVRAKLKAMGIDATVLDEYRNPSKGSTAGHIHVQFNSPDAALRYSQAVTRGAGPSSSVDRSSTSSTTTSTTTVGQVVVNTSATDGPGVARDFKRALEASSMAAHANAGQQ